MRARIALCGDSLGPEVLFGGESVVCRAAQCEVGFGVLASASVGDEMVKFETMRLATLLSVGVDVGATCTVALEDGAPNASRDVP